MQTQLKQTPRRPARAWFRDEDIPTLIEIMHEIDSMRKENRKRYLEGGTRYAYLKQNTQITAYEQSIINQYSIRDE